MKNKNPFWKSLYEIVFHTVLVIYLISAKFTAIDKNSHDCLTIVSSHLTSTRLQYVSNIFIFKFIYYLCSLIFYYQKLIGYNSAVIKKNIDHFQINQNGALNSSGHVSRGVW